MTGGVEQAGSCHHCRLEPLDAPSEYIGHLWIEEQGLSYVDTAR